MNKGDSIIVALIALAGLGGLAAIGVDSHRARPARLIALCNGVYMAGIEESDFPMDCQWIEPIRADTD